MKDGNASAENTTFSTSDALDAFMDSNGEKAIKPEKSGKIKKAKEPKKQGKLLEKIPYKKWQFWAICGGVVATAIIVGVIINNKGSDVASEDNEKWIPACSNGATDLISGGEWIVGKDVASGDYLFESNDAYAHAYIYKNKNVSSYDRTVSLDKNSTFMRLNDGQKIKVSSGNINMTCQKFDGFELLSSGSTMVAGSYTLVSVDSYFHAYVYEKESDSSYSATISLNEIGETKDFRFKDGQYLKISSGSAFLISKNADNYDELSKKVKELVGSKAVTEKKEEKKESQEEKKEEKKEVKPVETSSTPSTPTQQSSGNSEWKQFLKDYESWVDKYVTFMKKYKNASASDLAGMMSDYSSLMSEMTTWSNKASKMQSSLSGSDLTEYINTLNRVNQKLNSIY